MLCLRSVENQEAGNQSPLRNAFKRDETTMLIRTHLDSRKVNEIGLPVTDPPLAFAPSFSSRSGSEGLPSKSDSAEFDFAFYRQFYLLRNKRTSVFMIDSSGTSTNAPESESWVQLNEVILFFFLDIGGSVTLC